MGTEKPAGSEITVAELGTLQYATCSNEIHNLEGLEYATALTDLELRVSTVSTLAPITDLTQLVALRITGGSVQDLSPLRGLTNLRLLTLNKLGITDISELKGLVKLMELELRRNEITNLDPLEDLQELYMLKVDYNPLDSVNGLGVLAKLSSLEVMEASFCGITDFAPFAATRELGGLNLGYNEISDISALATSTSKGKLDLWNNRLMDITGWEYAYDASGQRGAATATVGQPVANPVKNGLGASEPSSSEYYDAATDSFTFPSAGTYTTPWDSATGSFNGEITWTVAAPTEVAPESPSVVQAKLLPNGKISLPSVIPAVTAGISYSLSIAAPQAGDTVTVTAAVLPGYVFALSTLPAGWAFDDTTQTASFTVKLDKVTAPNPVDPDTAGQEPVDSKPSGAGGDGASHQGSGGAGQAGDGSKLATTGGESAVGLAVGGALIVAAGVLLARRRRVDA